MLAIASICLLLTAPIQAAGDVSAHGVDQQGGRSTGKAASHQPAPLSADVQVSRGAQLTTDRFYRDSSGRTRYESGSTVTISDPRTATTVRLDTASRTYQLTSRDVSRTQTVQRPDGTVKSGQISSAPRALGTAQVQGVRAEGRTYTVTTPARAGSPAKTRTVTMWLSTDVQLALKLDITDSAGRTEYAENYTNLKVGVEPAAELFGIPAGYRDAARASTQSSIQAPCPLGNAPDPLVLNSYSWYWDGGYVTAQTDIMQGCVFVADGAIFEYPLWGGPTMALGLPQDQWVAFDTGGGGLPFLPWVAFGDIAFMASNFTDTTTKDSLVVLTVWCC